MVEQHDLRCVDIDKQFGAVTALHGINLTVQPGEFFAILGPSGCGKSTLLRILAGLEEPTRGRVLLDGKDITRTPAHHRPTNLVFQGGALFPHLSVRDNVAFGLRAQRVRGAALRSRVGELLEIMELTPYADRRPNQLSGGQAQRVAIARALARRPPVVLLDEPLSALDLNLQLRMRRELKQVQEQLGTVFVWVTHNQQEALELSDRVAVMNAGRVRQIAAPEELYHAPADSFVASFVGEINLFPGRAAAAPAADGLREVDIDCGVVRVGVDQPDLQAGPVIVAVRPEMCQVRGAADRSPDDRNRNRIRGRVETIYFRGSLVRYVVRAETGAVLLVDAASVSAGPHRGEAVEVTFAPTSTRLLAVEAT